MAFSKNNEIYFKDVAEELGLISIEGISENDIAYHRHPLAFLMEAADDIAYSIIDFEDGWRLWWINFEKEYLLEIEIEKEKQKLCRKPKQILTSIAKYDSTFNKYNLDRLIDIHNQISHFRSKVVNVLIHKAFEVFQKEYENIMTGKFDKALVDCIEISEIKGGLPFIKKNSRKMYLSS